MILLRSVAALALCASRLAAQAEARWVDVASDSAEAISIDTATVATVGEGVYRVWERSVALQTKKARVLARADFDCRLRLTRVVAVVLPGYQPVPASDEEREWTEIVPGSVYEAEWRQVCARASPAGTPR
jgi:Surface-adhesin protein E